MSPFEVAVIVTTFERPGHVRRALESISFQQDVAGKFEVVVVDDGSRDETSQVVAEFARGANFPVGFTTHPHDGFRVAQSRNEGVAASSAPYLLFVDGDCVLPADHIRIHLERRRRGYAMAGDSCRLTPEASGKVTFDTIRSGEFRHWGSADELNRMRKLARKSRFYEFIRHPFKPKLIGNNVGIWRDDYERVNGYDENFAGWGCEDDDLGFRLRRAGVRIRTILPWTHAFHLWHRYEATQPNRWREGVNVNYLLQNGRLICCRNGLMKRTTRDLTIRLVGQPAEALAARQLLGDAVTAASDGSQHPEVEILVLPGKGKFSGRADCNVLVALDNGPGVLQAARRADLLVASDQIPAAGQLRFFRLDEFRRALDAVA